MRLLNELVKNFKIIFRSWVSLALLVLGPLALIFLIGFTFGEQEVHSPQIGIIVEDQETASLFIDQVGEVAEVNIYEDVKTCTQHIKQGKQHICVDIAKEDNKDARFQRSYFTFYYDPAQNIVSDLLIRSINEVIGESAEQVSIETTKTILDNVQNMVSFLADKQDSLVQLVNESEQIKISLEERSTKLKEIEKEFTPSYVKIKQLQQSMNNLTIRLNDSQSSLEEKMLAQEQAVKDLQEVIDNLPSLSLFENASRFIKEQDSITYTLPDNTTVTVNPANLPVDEQTILIMLLLNQTLNELTNTTGTLQGDIKKSYTSLLLAKAELDRAVNALDDIKNLLDSEIKLTDESIIKIDVGVRNMQNISTELDQSLEQFSFINQQTAERIINPIIQEYSSLKEVTPVQRVFSGLLVMVVVFITLLFANILSLSEINSDAYFRSLIAPISDTLIPIGLLITNIILVSFQLTMLLIIAHLKFGLPVFSHAGEIYLLSTILVMLFTLIGMIIAFSFKDPQTSILTTTFLALAFYLFSSITAPLELMPELAASIAQYNPVVIAESLFRKLIIHDVSIFLSLDWIIILLIFTFVALLIWMLSIKRLVRSFR